LSRGSSSDLLQRPDVAAVFAAGYRPGKIPSYCDAYGMGLDLLDLLFVRTGKWQPLICALYCRKMKSFVMDAKLKQDACHYDT
jgi:hypothetical protein